MSLTVVVSDRSNGVTMRPDIWSGGRPVYCQTTPMTGIRISGKMSVGVRSAASGPMISSSSASTTKVYGRLSAMRTKAVMERVFLAQTEGIGFFLGDRWRTFTRNALVLLTQGRDPLMQFGHILNPSPVNRAIREGLMVAAPVT